MDGKLHSLTDVLKKTLFFFDTMSMAEMAPHVQRIMLKGLTVEQAEEKISHCLQQNKCFVAGGTGQWTIDLGGDRDNDHFYAMLLKRQQPLNIKEVVRGGGSKGKKRLKNMVSEEAGLISDGRFIQLANGYWGLTEWEVETGQYSLKQMVIKALKTHPGGLSVQQMHELVNSWKSTGVGPIEGVLNKFPYFDKLGDGIWAYNPGVHVAYDALTKRFLVSMGRQRSRWLRDREKRYSRQSALERQLKEINTTYRETASALALKLEETGRHEQLATQMAEKDLLLSLRKKEIFRYREHLAKLESKANSILYQCRLWVKKARDGAEENARLREALQKNQTSLETLFTKLQQYKEKDRDNKARLIELKDRHATRVAELQTEIVELKNKLDRTLEMTVLEERELREEINSLGNDLKDALEGREELNRSLRFVQQELNRYKEERKNIENKVNNPLVRLAMRIYSWFGGYKNYPAS
jgi:hypothetical protein